MSKKTRSPQRGSITPHPSSSIQVNEPTSFHQKPPSNLAQHSRSGRRKQHRTAVLHVQDTLKPTMSPYLSPAKSIKLHGSNRDMDFRPLASVPRTPRSQKSYRSDSLQVRDWEGNATRILSVDWVFESVSLKGSSICFLLKQIKMEEEQEYEDQEDETEDRSEFFSSKVTYSLHKLQNSELKLIFTSYIQNSSKWHRCPSVWRIKRFKWKWCHHNSSPTKTT